MHTISKTIHPAEYNDVKSVVEVLQQGDLQQVQTLLQQLKSRQPDSDSAAAVQQGFFLEALSKRISEKSTESKNLYLQGDQGQQIKMFNFMAEKFPVVKYAQEIANQTIISQLNENQPTESLTIIDIGIGTGQQVVNLIEKIYQENGLLIPVTIVGIEPAQDSLETARKRIEGLSEAYPGKLSFVGIHKTFEALNEEDWLRITHLVEETRSRVCINASFALHHIQPVHLRQALFSRLKELNPLAFVLIEPYADYITPDLSTRFNNAWHHYGLTFKAIDSIDAPTEEKNAVKRVFFGREIQDVLAHDNARVEQFETAEMWLDKLKSVGFTPLDLGNALRLESCHPLINISLRADYLGLDVEGHPIVAVMAVRGH